MPPDARPPVVQGSPPPNAATDTNADSGPSTGGGPPRYCLCGSTNSAWPPPPRTNELPHPTSMSSNSGRHACRRTTGRHLHFIAEIDDGSSARRFAQFHPRSREQRQQVLMKDPLNTDCSQAPPTSATCVSPSLRATTQPGNGIYGGNGSLELKAQPPYSGEKKGESLSVCVVVGVPPLENRGPKTCCCGDSVIHVRGQWTYLSPMRAATGAVTSTVGVCRG